MYNLYHDFFLPFYRTRIPKLYRMTKPLDYHQHYLYVKVMFSVVVVVCSCKHEREADLLVP